MRTLGWALIISLLCLTTSCDTGSTTETTPPPATETDKTAQSTDTSQPGATAQSETEEDIRISAAIRKSVVDDKSLSVSAHNATITTSNGAVTLRGTVKSDQEKASIESKAKQVAGVTKVDNLLEVERTP